jgi:hypothetical protein
VPVALLCGRAIFIAQVDDSHDKIIELLKTTTRLHTISSGKQASKSIFLEYIISKGYPTWLSNDHVRNVLIELLGGVRIACFY